MADCTSPPLACGLIFLLGSGCRGPRSWPGSALMFQALQSLSRPPAQPSVHRATEQLPLFSAGESSSFLDKYPLRFSSGNIIVCSLTEKKGSATHCQGTLLHSGGLLMHPSPSYLSFYKCVDLSSGMFHLLCHFLTANCVRRPLKGRDFVSFFTRLI